MVERRPAAVVRALPGVLGAIPEELRCLSARVIAP